MAKIKQILGNCCEIKIPTIINYTVNDFKITTDYKL